MNALDLLILGFVASAVALGFHRGLWLTALEYTGLVVGVIGGALLAPVVIQRLDSDHPLVRVMVVLGVVGAASLVGSTISHELGAPIRRAARRLPKVAVLDGIGGAALTALATLGTIWYAGLMLSRGPSDMVAGAIQHSAILRHIDDRVPRPPMALAQLQEQLSAQVFPQVFVGLEPRLPTQVEADAAAIDTPGVRAAAASTVRVEAPGCGGIQLGSGFVVAPERVVTNAHVISGTRGVNVVRQDSPYPLAGRVLFLDPARDLALVHVPGLDLPPLQPGDAERGMQVAIIGFPGGGAREVGAAVVSTEMLARGRDIYHERPVTRSIWVVEGRARPGNSGGPLVDARGRYLGVVFAESVTAADQAYALTADEVGAALREGDRSIAPVDPRTFPCAS